MKAVKNIVSQLNRQLFNTVTKNRLVYNTCWEDSRIDRQLLQLGSSSRVLMLTSAGDNALNYLLDDPAEIFCVDINPAQNALLHLKKSIYLRSTYSSLWNMFGKGKLANAPHLYYQTLRVALPASSQSFWDDHLHYFDPSTAGSFYHHGTAGTFAGIIVNRLLRKGLYRSSRNLLAAQSIAEQRYYFDEIAPQLWSSFLRWLISQDATLALLGVPKTQRAIIDNEVSGGLAAYIQQAIENVFTQRTLKDNYFWRVYLTGSYTSTCCPAYLRKNNYRFIKQRIDRLEIKSSSLIKYLENDGSIYSHFILLDHQDWLAHYQPPKLAREWKLILSHAQPGTRILFRSAGKTRSFVPSFVQNHVQFKDSLTKEVQAEDRVGTYGSTHLAVVTEPLQTL